MMLRKSLFALSAVLLLGATAACGDDDNKKKDDNNNGDVSCDEKPNQDKCQTGGDDDPCVANPDQDICKMDDARDALAYSYVNGLVIPDESSPCCWDFAANSNEIDKEDRKSTRLNSSHVAISYAVFCLKKKKPAKDKGPCEET